jgi:hypothetical protein
MGSEAVQKALKGERVFISAASISIDVDMTMSFEGLSCNIVDQNEQLVKEIREADGDITQIVDAGSRCYVVMGYVHLVPR